MFRIAAFAACCLSPREALSERTRARVLIFMPLVAVWLIALLLVLSLVAARAAEPGAPAGTVVDFGPAIGSVINWAWAAIVAVVVGLGLLALSRLTSFLGLKVNAQQRATVEQGLTWAVNYALAKLGDKAAGGIPIDCKSEAIAVAARYANKVIPDALKHFGKTDADVAKMVEARLEHVLVDPNAPLPNIRALAARPVVEG